MARNGEEADMASQNFLNPSLILKGVLILIGLHSVILGGTIYSFPVPFYELFFSGAPEDLFYIKQSGVFLFLAGFFYSIPALDLIRYRLIIGLVVFSKIIAVAFLIGNAQLTSSPPMIYLAAFGDGFMAAALTLATILWRLKSAE